MSAPFPVPAQAYIAAVRRDPDLARIAVRLYSEHAANLLERDPKTAITRSDAGRCGRQVAEEIAGGYSIEDGPTDSRDEGSRAGLWYACFLKVAIETRHPNYTCLLEREATWRGIPGHADLSVYEHGHGERAVYVWECKKVAKFDVVAPHEPVLSRAKGKEGVVLHDPETRYCLQTACGALAEGAPIFSVSVFGIGSAFAQGDYDTASWLPAVEAEYARIARGEMDPVKDWQCRSCRVGRCPQNVNPDKEPSLADWSLVPA